MPITDEQKEKVIEWLKNHNAFKKCDICERPNWSIQDVVLCPRYLPGGRAGLKPPFTPMVQIVCKNCGNVRLFAATPILSL